MDKRAVRRSRLANNKPSGELLQATASGKSRESLRMTGECRDYDEVDNLACCSSLKKERQKVASPHCEGMRSFRNRRVIATVV